MNDIKEQGDNYSAGAMPGRFAEAAFHAMQNLGQGFKDAAPDLYNAVHYAFDRLGDAMRDVNLGQKAHDAIWAIIDAFNGIMDGFFDHVYGVMSGIGQHLIQGLVDGIKNTTRYLRDTLSSLTGAIPDWVKRQLGIGSPSKVMMDIGENLPTSLAVGAKRTADEPLDVLNRLASLIGGAMTGVTTSAQVGAAAAGAVYNNQRS